MPEVRINEPPEPYSFELFLFEEPDTAQTDVKVFDYQLAINEAAVDVPVAKETSKKVKSFGVLKVDQVDLDTIPLSHLEERIGSYYQAVTGKALNSARNIKVHISSTKSRVYQMQKNANLYTIEKFKKYAQALACLLMFMIGAPLGAIIKKGGLGVPTIVAIFFFIIYYVFTSIGEKSAKEGAMNPYFAVWLADLVLLPFGLFFLRQARADARLFDVDFYNIWLERLRTRFARNNK
jgi:lipopolysaccharide export LptBFGC system permease protein LptF